MKVCITKVTEIIGKDAREWTKIDFVAANGETGTAMVKKGDAVFEEDDISKLVFDTDLEFNQRGRLVV